MRDAPTDDHYSLVTFAKVASDPVVCEILRSVCHCVCHSVCSHISKPHDQISQTFRRPTFLLSDSAIYDVFVCPSVCLSVTRRYCTKTAKRKMSQTTPYHSFLMPKKSPRNSNGVTQQELVCALSIGAILVTLSDPQLCQTTPFLHFVSPLISS